MRRKEGELDSEAVRAQSLNSRSVELTTETEFFRVMNKDEIYVMTVDLLHEMFEIDKSKITQGIPPCGS